MSDPVSIMINEANDPGAWLEAATIVRTRVTTGQADASLIHHLMVRGWRVLDTFGRTSNRPTDEIAVTTGYMTRRMVDVLDTAVGQSI